MLQAVLASLVGLAACAAAISLLLVVGDRRDPVPRWHFVVSSGFVAFCLAQAIRNASPDPAVHDIAQRAIGAGASLFFLGVLEFCRHIARQPRSRIDAALGATLGALAAYAALSPGGLHSTRIAEVARWSPGGNEELFRHQRQLSLEREGLLRDVQEREGMLSALLDHGLTLSCLLDPQGRVVLANRTALALAGLAPGKIRGRPLFDVPPWTSKSSAQRRLRAAAAQAAEGELDRFQIRHETPEGAAVDIDYSLAPYRQSTGEVRWLIAEGRDITALRQMEERLQVGHRLEAIGQRAGDSYEPTRRSCRARC